MSMGGSGIYRSHRSFVVFVRDGGNDNYVGNLLGPVENGGSGSCAEPA